MQSLANVIKELSDYRSQLEAIADLETKTLETKTQLAAVQSQLVGLREATSGMSLSQYKSIKDLDEKIFVSRKRLEELELEIPKAQALLNSYSATNTATKFKHDQMEAQIIQFRASFKGGGTDAS